MGIKHSLVRQFISNPMNDGYIIENSADLAYPHSDGTANISIYPGQNRFEIGFKRTLYGSGQLANLLWDFFLTRLDNINEPFYFYNCPIERATPDLTGVDTVGRYFVKLEDPNQVLNRQLFLFCLYSYSFAFIENKNLNTIDYLAIAPPWSYWKMDEVGNAIRADQSGYGRDLTPSTGLPEVTEMVGKIGNSVLFIADPGGSAGLTLNSKTIDLSSNKEVFISFWFKWDRVNVGAATAIIISTGSSGLKISAVVAVGSSAGNITCTTPTLSIASANVITEGNWHLIQVYYDGEKLVLQINNTFDTNNFSYVIGDSKIIYQVSDVFTIASFTPVNICNMHIDESGIWDGIDAITMINQKKVLYNSGNGLTYPIVLV